MLTSRLFFLAFLVNTARCIQFKSCSEVPFCSKFRNHAATKSEYFTADVDDAHHDGKSNILSVPLTNQNDGKLKLQVSFLSNRTLRLKILEVNRERYELKDVLDHEPDAVKYDITEQTNQKLCIHPHGIPDASIIINRGPPFSLEFANKTQTHIVFDSSQLKFESAEEGEAFSFNVGFHGSTNLYGLHHHADVLTLRETVQSGSDPYRLKNVDAGQYQTNSTKSLYGAVPVIYGHSKEKTSGIFLHNAAQQWVDITYKENSKPSAHFIVEGGTLDLFVFFGPTLKDVVKQYVDLTGRMHMPQIWTLGYHQCRYSYLTQDDVKEVATKMEENYFPMDAIWLDIDYTDGKKYFTWNPQTYSDPVDLQHYLTSLNKRLVTIIDPHIKVDREYPVYEGARGKYFVKWENGSDFQVSLVMASSYAEPLELGGYLAKSITHDGGHDDFLYASPAAIDYIQNLDIRDCWPGLSSYIDFLNPEARTYIANWYQYEKFNGSTETLAGIWNDMNEPAVFNLVQWENTFPPELVHHGNVRHRDIHNIYGFLQTKATYEGLLARDKHLKRPFILTRSHFAGSQRYAAMWTGDNTGDWPHLQVTYSECILSNLVGHVFCGADVGGFFWNPESELLQRWYQAGVWLPFYRGHSNIDTNRREPYLFPDEVQEVIRDALRTRYKHLPVFYTLFHQHVTNGDPVVRPLFYEYPDMVDIDDHILIGTDILATPVMEKDARTKTVHFPGNQDTYWYRADLPTGNWTVHRGGTTETFDVDIKTSPYFYRSGSIIVVTNEKRTSTHDILKDQFTIHVNLDTKGDAIGYYYSDDGVSFDYKEKDDFFLLELKYRAVTDDVHSERVEGNRKVEFSFKEIVTHKIPQSGNIAPVSMKSSTNN